MLAMLSYDFQKSEMIFVPENAYAHICKSIGNEVSSTAQKKKSFLGFSTITAKNLSVCRNIWITLF